MTKNEIELAAISEAQRTMLTQRTPESAIKQRQGKGGKTFSYVEHAWVTEQLNLAFGWGWSWKILEWQMFPENGAPLEVFVLGELTVHGQGGATLVKSQFGSSDVKRDKGGNILSIGDDLKAASSDALKKCASLLGLALDLYKSDDDPGSNGKGKSPKKGKAGGKNLGSDPATLFWAKAKEHGLDTDLAKDILKEIGGDFEEGYKRIVFEYEESGA